MLVFVPTLAARGIFLRISEWKRVFRILAQAVNDACTQINKANRMREQKTLFH